jgi:hypothetical protein
MITAYFSVIHLIHIVLRCYWEQFAGANLSAVLTVMGNHLVFGTDSEFPNRHIPKCNGGKNCMKSLSEQPAYEVTASVIMTILFTKTYTKLITYS